MADFEFNINNDSVLKELKTAFQKAYPYLKLEFFQKHHAAGNGSPAKEILADRFTVADLHELPRQGSLHVSDHMTVQDLEAEFDQRFGLHVQVFRKSGKIWLETSVTDKWTLERQNAHGAESEIP